MNSRILALVASAAIVVSASTWLAAQSGPPGLQGAWTIQEVTTPQPPPRAMDKPTGLIQFSGRHYSTVVSTVGVRPALPEGGANKATADQLRAAWGPLTANAGTFAVTGNIIRQTYVVAKNPVGAGNVAEWSFTLRGDSLVMTQVRDRNGPATNPVTVRLARAK